MAGLVPATQIRKRCRLIRVIAAANPRAAVLLGGRDKPGHDEARRGAKRTVAVGLTNKT
jgi:hypothetical protein